VGADGGKDQHAVRARGAGRGAHLVGAEADRQHAVEAVAPAQDPAHRIERKALDLRSADLEQVRAHDLVLQRAADDDEAVAGLRRQPVGLVLRLREPRGGHQPRCTYRTTNEVPPRGVQSDRRSPHWLPSSTGASR
jgi:hypothetical protein